MTSAIDLTKLKTPNDVLDALVVEMVASRATEGDINQVVRAIQRKWGIISEPRMVSV